MAKKKEDWRVALAIYPACEQSGPLMNESQLAVLAEDIKQHGGFRKKPVLWRDEDGKLWLLDGRNRLDAHALNGGTIFRVAKKGAECERSAELNLDLFQIIKTKDPDAYVRAANRLRVHLTTEQKRELIAEAIKAAPTKTAREIARELGGITTDKTVASVKAELEANAEIPHNTERKEKSGRKARGVKPGTTKKAKTAKTPIVPVPESVRASSKVLQEPKPNGQTQTKADAFFLEKMVERGELAKIILAEHPGKLDFGAALQVLNVFSAAHNDIWLTSSTEVRRDVEGLIAKAEAAGFTNENIGMLCSWLDTFHESWAKIRQMRRKGRRELPSKELDRAIVGLAEQKARIAALEQELQSLKMKGDPP